MNVEVTGVRDIDRVLRGMPLQLTDKVLSQAAAAAAKPLIEKEKLLAPRGKNGFLIASIGAIKSGFSNVLRGNRGVGEVQVGPRRRKGRYMGFHAHLVEYGTKRRKTKRGANRGVMPKQPFVYPAFQATKDQVLGLYGQEVGRKLYAFMRRTIK